MYQLHYFPSNANAAPHVVLEEFDQKYDLVLVDRAKNAQKSKHYLKINLMVAFRLWLMVISQCSRPLRSFSTWLISRKS